MAVAPAKTRGVIYEGSRIPQPTPTILHVPQETLDTGDVLTLNFGPNHPSTHGVLRLVVDLDSPPNLDVLRRAAASGEVVENSMPPPWVGLVGVRTSWLAVGSSQFISWLAAR